MLCHSSRMHTRQKQASTHSKPPECRCKKQKGKKSGKEILKDPVKGAAHEEIKTEKKFTRKHE